MYEWACFASHQAAEKALKALFIYHGREVWGHSVVQLLRLLESIVEVPPDLLDVGRRLDQFYIPTRYPNAHPTGAPFEFFTQSQSEEALHFAQQIVEFARAHMALP